MVVGIYDVHAHVYENYYSLKEIEEMLLEAKDIIKGVVVVGESLKDVDAVLKICDLHDKLYPSLGLHPVQRDADGKPVCVKLEDLNPMLKNIRTHKDKLIAIGEVGLDFSPWIVGQKGSEEETESKQIQIEVFKKQIELNKELNLPLNVHSRNAGHHAIEKLVESQAKNVVLHAFDGKEKFVQMGVKEGFYFSIPPSFAVKNTSWVKNIPLDNVLIETDCPTLGPVKGEKNRLLNGRLSLEFIAKEHKISIEECSVKTQENSKRLFKFQ